MSDLPDAPWIVDAEFNGCPASDPVPCPVCGSENCDHIYLNKYDEPVGCEYCLQKVEIWEWAEMNGGDEK